MTTLLGTTTCAERQPARNAILPQDPSVSRLQPALCRTLGPHALQHHQHVRLCSRCKQQLQGYFQRNYSRCRRDRRACCERERGTQNKPQAHAYLKWLIYTAAFKDPFEASQYLALLRLRSKSDRRRSAPLDDPDSEGQDERAHPGPAADGNGAGGLVVATVVPLVNEWMNL